MGISPPSFDLLRQREILRFYCCIVFRIRKSSIIPIATVALVKVVDTSVFVGEVEGLSRCLYEHYGGVYTSSPCLEHTMS
ncbi:hypothetical protein L1049_010029 [Liquidambar formosana]|uniref:Uncharacterized protein n=1 Tax=Liquidambar formosana TaxID=63359 RepID=A0AAP0R412_LIQFO